MPHQFDLVGTAFKAMEYFVPFLFALCFHEYAHGWVARLRGDRTAEMMGRLTLNPMAHADMVGTVILPLLALFTNIPFFGWAKPVPVDERNLKKPKTDMFWVALAGPMSNLLLGLVGAIALGLFARFNGEAIMEQQRGAVEIVKVAQIIITINVFLAIFNFIPVHPLDGAKILARFLPYRVNRQLEAWSAYTSLILLLVFFSGGMAIIAAPAMWVSRFFLGLAGVVA